jgi:tetratricopeptide (TPR) repeat protein/tRNA A-37 threonylcarbamoyl transferase component Bud32
VDTPDDLERKERWEAVSRLFGQAVELPPGERDAFLNEACAGDPRIREEVESLLDADADATEALAGTVADAASTTFRQYAPGQRIGAYQVISLIGHGGMGAVYLAERADGAFQQRVAIKLLNPGLGQDFARHFLRERQILARLQHANIARLLDGGSTPEGKPYFVMEYVDGQSINRYCDAREATVAQRLELFRSVCDAVSYAHRNLVIHRDLKPGNLLVTDEGAVKLLDFGIAKLIESAPRADATALPIMTLDYASPEQVRGESVTTATDVYSLGAILYRLLTGGLPHAPATTAYEVQRAIVEQDPTRPSAIKPELGADIDAIVRMAMRKEPERRYPSVELLSEDVRRYLASEPVLARRGSWRYRAGKFIHRHRVAAALASVSMAALAVTTGIAVRQARRAERRFGQVQRLAGSFLFDFESSIHSLPGSTAARRLVVQTGLEYLESLAQDAGRDRRLLLELADGYQKISEIQSDSHGANLGDTAGALASIAKAQAIREKLGGLSTDPAVRGPYIEGWLLQADAQELKKDLKSERASLEKALALTRAWLALEPENRDALMLDGRAHIAMGYVELRAGALMRAREACATALATFERMAARWGDDKTIRQRLGESVLRLGDVEVRAGDPSAAERSMRRAVGIFESLAPPRSDTRAMRAMMVAYARLGDVLGAAGSLNVGKPEEAFEYYRKAIAITEEAMRGDPSNAGAISDLSGLYSRMGELLIDMGRNEEGLENSHRSLDFSERLVALDPQNVDARLGEALNRAHYAHALYISDRLDQAIAERERAQKTYGELLAASPDDTKVVLPLITNSESLGRWSKQAGRLDRADTYLLTGIAAGEHVASARPDDGYLLEILGNIYQVRGDLAAGRKRWDTARECYRKALDLRSRIPGAGSRQAANVEQSRRALARLPR